MSGRRVPICWEVLITAYQGVSDDPQTQPLLCVDSGEITCATLLEPLEVEERLSSGTLLPLPTKDGVAGYNQRKSFAESLCDPDLATQLDDALTVEHRFHAFDKVLEGVPIEAHRWREEERRMDVEALCGWLSRAGLFPDPPPMLTRKIIEFPFRKPVSEE